MTEKIELLQDRLASEIKHLEVTAYENPAVARCARAWMLAYSEVRLKGDPETSARSRAGIAYRMSMPPLTGSRNVRDFIACTTHGMLFGVLDGDETTRLLYAAQVAHSARRSKNQTKKTVQEPDSPANEPFPNQPQDT